MNRMRIRIALARALRMKRKETSLKHRKIMQRVIFRPRRILADVTVVDFVSLLDGCYQTSRVTAEGEVGGWLDWIIENWEMILEFIMAIIDLFFEEEEDFADFKLLMAA